MESNVCKKCSRNFDIEKRKPLILKECSHQVCEDCYRYKLEKEADGAKTCPFCLGSSYNRKYNWNMIKLSIQKDIETQKEQEIQKEKEIQRKRQEESKSRQSTLSQTASTVSSTRTNFEVIPKIDPNDIPLESELKQKYRKEQYLGKGSFGDVYSASSRQRFAIKAFKEQPTEQDLIEISIMKGIKSQYLCELFDLFKNNEGKYSIVYEYAKFGDLLKYSRDTLEWNIPENLAKEWLASVVLGLKELHQRGIIHRDIKADNILVFKEDEVRIADYGQAKVMGDSQSKRPYGTLNYLSPEMRNCEYYDSSTDIYSLGITFIYLLTQKFPKESEIKDPFWLPKIEGISDEFINLLRSMVYYNQNDRPSTVDIMFHPLIAETKVMREYKQVYGKMTLGFANFKPDLMKKLQEQGIGCKNCTLVLCSECFRKKVESSFLMLNDMLGHANEISFKIEELVNEAKQELDICQEICPYINSVPYIEILGISDKMVKDNVKHQEMRTDVQKLIQDFEPQIVITTQQVIENAREYPDFASENRFSAIIQKVKQQQQQLSSNHRTLLSRKIVLPKEKINKKQNLLALRDPLIEEQKFRQIDSIQHEIIRENIGFSLKKLLKAFTNEDFRKIVDEEINKRGSFIRKNIPNFDNNGLTTQLQQSGSLVNFSIIKEDNFKGILIFIQTNGDLLFGFYTSNLSGKYIEQGCVFNDKDAFIFSLSYQTIHKLKNGAEFSMLATKGGLQIGGSLSTGNPDIFLDINCTEKNSQNSSNLGQSYSLPSDTFEKDSYETKTYLPGNTTYTVKQIETYHIYERRFTQSLH
eukprot:403370542